MTNHQKLTDETGTRSLDPKHAPVSLPAGSFDYDKLMKGFEGVVAAPEDKRDAAVRKAIEHGAHDKDILATRDNAAQAGFITQEVEHETIEGLVENRSVFVAEEAQKVAAAEAQDTTNSASAASTAAK